MIDIDIHEKIFKDILCDLKFNGKFVSPRGQLVLEIENFSCVFPPFVRFQNFKCRKLKLDYIREEFLWYLKGDKYDLSIVNYATMWANMVSPNGYINSNYGQYIFGKQNQFDNIINILREDKDSRRASIVILNSNHLLNEKEDIPCTYAINFRIRNCFLNMSVKMRSQDAIYGMGSDIPIFSIIHEMVLNLLRKTYPDLKYGNYHHSVDSFHIYERHFIMLEKIVSKQINEINKYEIINCPPILNSNEVNFIRKLDFSNIPKNFEFSQWLAKRDNAKKVG